MQSSGFAVTAAYLGIFFSTCCYVKGILLDLGLGQASIQAIRNRDSKNNTPPNSTEQNRALERIGT